MKKILIIVGSQRKDSFNRQLAEAFAEVVGTNAEVSMLSWRDVPLFDQDSEYPTPASVASAREQVLAADALYIVTPEYNFHVPGTLKNLLDWLSRPLEEGNWEKGSAVKGKAVAIAGAAGKSKAFGARKNLAAILQAMRMNLIGAEGFGIEIGSGYETGKLALTEEEKSALAKQAEMLLKES